MSAETPYIADIEFQDAEVRADAVFEMRIPPFMVRYLKDDREQAKKAATDYARKLLRQEYEREIQRLLTHHVRAEVVFVDEHGNKETERLSRGEWRTL